MNGTALNGWMPQQGRPGNTRGKNAGSELGLSDQTVSVSTSLPLHPHPPDRRESSVGKPTASLNTKDSRVKDGDSQGLTGAFKHLPKEMGAV